MEQELFGQVANSCLSRLVAVQQSPARDMTRERWMAWSFALGSACFLIGPFPGYADRHCCVEP